MHRQNSRSISHRGLLGIGRELRAEHGRSLTLDVFCRETGLSPEFLCERFGSWEQFRRALGMTLPVRSRKRRFSNTELLAHLRRLGDENQNITLWEYSREVGVSIREIYDRFKSWRNMREAAGLPRMVTRRPEYSKADMMNDLLQIWLKAGRCPGYHDHKRWGGKIAATTMLARFGSWRGVQAGFELYRRKYLAKTDPTWSWEKECEERRRKQLRQQLGTQ